MKKLIFITAITFIGFQTYCQQPNLNNLVYINLPVGIKTITSSDAKDFIAKNLNKSLIPTTDGGSRTSYYKIENIIFQFTTVNRPVKIGQLMYLKRSFDITYKKYKAYKSMIRTFNGYNILILKHPDNFSTTDFFCFSNSNDKGISGSVFYNTQDETQANILLEACLATIKFSGE